jgi:hypothetical protein
MPATAGSQRPVIAQPTPDRAAAASNAEARSRPHRQGLPVRPERLAVSAGCDRKRLSLWCSRDDDGERDRAAGTARTLDEIVTADGYGCPERVRDDLEVSELGFDFRESWTSVAISASPVIQAPIPDPPFRQRSASRITPSG